jgi:hypothetical protein
MVMSNPVTALLTVLCCAFQSLMMYPGKPSSSFISLLLIASLSHAQVPLTLLYEHITDATLALTASMNGHTYSSCAARSPILELIVSR